MAFLKLYFVSLVLFFFIDLLWLGVIAKNLYRDQLGVLMAEKVKWGPALIFYGVYLAGLVFFAVLPSLREHSSVLALSYGGFFGLVCYATYDLTNLATLRGWPIPLVIYDLLWGTFISAVTSFITFWVGDHWKNYLN